MADNQTTPKQPRPIVEAVAAVLRQIRFEATVETRPMTDTETAELILGTVMWAAQKVRQNV